MSDNRSYRERARLNRVRRKRENKKKRMYITIGVIVVVIGIVILGIVLSNCLNNTSDKEAVSKKKVAVTTIPDPTEEPVITPTPFAFKASPDADTEKFSKSVASKYGVVIDVENEKVVAQKGYKKMIYPASMTKVMTVLVAAEQVSEMQL